MKASKHKKWSKRITGNVIFQGVTSPIREYVEYTINQINLQLYKGRPNQRLNLSLGDPTSFKEFRTDKSNLELTAALSIAQKDDYTQHIQILEQARGGLAVKYSAESYDITKDDVYITAGGGHSLAAVAQLLADAGDNFLFPTPSFPFLLSIANLYGIKVRLYTVRSEQNWEANLQEVQSLIDERTKFIVVNDPSNPLGSCWSNEFKVKVLALCHKHNIPLLADQIYESISCDQSLLSFTQLSKTSKATIFKCSGLAKRYSLPGWRIGWIIIYADKEAQRAYHTHLSKILKIFGTPNTVAQNAINALINNPLNDQSMGRKVSLIQNNLLTLNTGLSQMRDYFQQTKSSGAIYAAINVNLENFKAQIGSIVDFCKLLYAEENILILPGTIFGGKTPFIRMLVSCDNQKITLFCQRLKNFCLKYGK